MYKIYIDGGSRGNPGPAGFGVVFIAGSGGVLKQYSEVIGTATNNEAEYRALIFALKKVKVLFGREKAKKSQIDIYSDSELLVKQMNGKYKIKHPAIQKLFLQAWNLKVEFKHISFNAIPREQNKIADRLVNQTLDAEAKTQKLF